MKPRHWLFLLLVALTAARYVLAAAYELSSDECYYYLWSQHPALSYYSKGPGVAMAIGVEHRGFRSHGVRRALFLAAARAGDLAHRLFLCAAGLQ